MHFLVMFCTVFQSINTIQLLLHQFHLECSNGTLNFISGQSVLQSRKINSLTQHSIFKINVFMYSLYCICKVQKFTSESESIYISCLVAERLREEAELHERSEARHEKEGRPAQDEDADNHTYSHKEFRKNLHE